jgi:hypothetical protein
MKLTVRPSPDPMAGRTRLARSANPGVPACMRVLSTEVGEPPAERFLHGPSVG